MASSDLKFTYFDLRGTGEIPRLILAYAKKEYKDVRVTFEEWPNIKPTMPLDQIPILEVDGDTYPQSVAIINYLAREFGLYPQNTKDQLRVDVVMAVYCDVTKCQATWYYDQDGEEKTRKHEKAKVDSVKFLKFIDDFIGKYGKSSGFTVGDSLTLADVVIFDLVTGYHRHSLVYSPEAYPRIGQVVESVLKVENIGAYVASRPDSKW